jgi:hypothetical protein
MSDDPLPIREPAATSDLSGHLPPPSPTPRWRLFDRLVVLVFCLGLIVPGLLMVARIRPAAIENRPLLEPPALAAGSLLDPSWYAAVDRFLADNVAVRPLAVRIRGEAYWRSGGTGNPAVVRGVGPWLFTIDEIQPRCDLAVTDIAAALDRTKAAFAASGQDFRFLVAPDKHAVYPEKVAPGTPYGPACTDERRAAMNEALAGRPDFTIDGWTAVLAERAAHPDGPLLYYAKDSHWTTNGAVPAVRDLVRSLGPDLWREDDVVAGPAHRVVMELARQMGLAPAETVPGLTVRPGVAIVRTLLDLPVKTSHSPGVYRYTASGDRPLVSGRTVIVYDSFFGLNTRAVAPFFAESVWIHIGDLQDHPEIAALVGRADRVILERVERGLYTTDIDDLLGPLVRPKS